MSCYNALILGDTEMEDQLKDLESDDHWKSYAAVKKLMRIKTPHFS